MRRASRFACVAVLALAACTRAHAQNASNGQEIYQSVCASCHGPAAADAGGIVTVGANDPAAILRAWQSNIPMRFLVSLFSAADRADIAAYLGAVKADNPVTDGGAPPADAVNYQGLWWGGPTENGWGLNFAHQGDVIFVTWYTYDGTGKAAWLTMMASKTSPGVYAGPILETHGSPYTASPYDPSAKQDAAVGSGTMTFTSATAGTLVFTAKNVSRTLAISKFSLSGATPVCTYSATANLATATNYQDVWWGGPAENGMGVNFAHDGDLIFATWFIYDTDGSPMWLFAVLQRSAANVYSGELDRGRSAPFGATYDASKFAVDRVGDVTLTVADGDSATWAYSIGTTAGTKTLSRVQFGPGGTMCQ